jgi:hypothetical protein
MADTRPTKLRFFYKIYICFLGIFNPKKLIDEEKKDTEFRSGFSDKVDTEHNAYIVNRAFWSSLGLIIIFGLTGALMSKVLSHLYGQPANWLIILLQILGASLLLWGTLFVRGWQIQTRCGVTLTERVNLWIYRALYCVGTSILICSIVWGSS